MYSDQPYFGDVVVKFNVRVFVRQTLIWFRVPGFIDAFGNVIYCKRQKALTYYQAAICHFSIDQTLGFVRFPQVLKVKSFSFALTCVYSQSRVVQMDVLIPETITTWVVQGVARCLELWVSEIYLFLWNYIFSRKRRTSLSFSNRVNYHLEEIRVILWVNLEKEYCSDFLKSKFVSAKVQHLFQSIF